MTQTKTPTHKAGAQLEPYFTESCAVLAGKMNLNKGETHGWCLLEAIKQCLNLHISKEIQA